MSWLVFAISAIVYWVTMEKSASVWDCPEFITTFHKLEVGHPPGAPFYMLAYNAFAELFPAHGDWIAIASNALSGLLSGLTILLLFRTISHLIRRSFILRTASWREEAEIPADYAWIALGSALVGSLTYAFTDTFWYSAVESEVYAFSSFFTALVFYLILKWEETRNPIKEDRWLLLTAYLMGLSVGVHLLNLLAIPAMALVYYFKRTEKATWKGGLVATLLSFVLVAVILFGIIPGVPEVAGYFDLFFVNTLGLSYNSGLICYVLVLALVMGLTVYASMRRPVPMTLLRVGFLSTCILLGIPFMGSGWIVPIIVIAALVWYLWYSKRTDAHRLAHLTMAMGLLFAGISTYGVILVRANSDIPMNQNTPADVFALRYYLSREQYGSTPLIYGQTYASLPEYDAQGRPVTTTKVTYARTNKLSPDDPDHYERQESSSLVYRSDMKMLFPRVYSNMMPHFKQGYEIWGEVKGETKTVNQAGKAETVTLPTFGENLRYFFSYQLNYMYWRYFLWNFSGRQNDIQGQGELTKGNWITGIPFIDGIFLGPQKDLPSFVTDNPGHNRYFMLPLILGLLGLIAQLLSRRERSRQNFWIILSLFFMTGIAIVLYVNQTPYQVRERDYSYAGSFYAFSIWIGCGVFGLYDLITGERSRKKSGLALGLTAICLLVPTLVAWQNWDDHDRSGRRLAADTGNNYLNSCEPNGIIYCNGDNDTFPLWYAQEVEGVRTDLKVCNSSYLQADWYIEQMKKQTYEAAPMPITWGLKEYGGDKRGIAYVVPVMRDTLELRHALDFIGSDDPSTKDIPGIVQKVDYLPSTKVALPYDPADLIQRGVLYPSDTAYIKEPVTLYDFSGKNYLGKEELVSYDMIEANKWKRPIYFCITVGESNRMGLTPYFRQTGMAYQVLPIRTKGTSSEVDVERMYTNVMERFRWAGADHAGTYMDENARRMLETYRSMIFAPLAKGLVARGDSIRAREVLERSKTAILDEVVPHGASSLPLVGAFYDAGMTGDAEEITSLMLDRSLRDLDWYFRLNDRDFITCMPEIEREIIVAEELMRLNRAHGSGLETKYGKDCDYYSKAYLQIYNQLSGATQQ